MGDDYRDLWTAAIEVEVLHLQTFAGGLTPVMRVGGMQTLGLALKGQDGRDYSFRSVDKVYSEETIPPAFRGTFLEDVIQDQIAANFPGVQVVTAPIETAAGVLALPDPRLVVMPDDPALGEFREAFAGVLGVISEFPQPVSDSNPGFHGATEILSPEDFWEQRQAGTQNLPDTRSFLRARLLDILLNDWDRHHRQWRWARFPDQPLLQPIPEDRDQVFTDFRGILLGLARFQGAQFVKYEEEFEPFRRATKNGWDVDRFLLTDIERREWMQIASDLQSRLTDEVLNEGLQRMPEEYYELRGEEVATKLKMRRDAITEMAARYYAYLADEVDVQCTNENERVTIEGFENGDIEVRVATLQADQASSAPYYRRRFDKDETDEVRIYLHGGSDIVVTEGKKGPGITVRVIGGRGSNTVDDSNGFGVNFYGSEGDNHLVGDNGTRLDTKPVSMPPRRPPNDTPWVPAQDWGGMTKPLVVAGYQSDPGFTVGAGFDNTNHGFRKYPWANRHILKGAFAFGVMRPFLDYKGSFRRENSRFGYVLEARISGLDQLRYYGLGNETSGDLDDGVYKISQYQLSLFPGVALLGTENGRLALGPVVKYTNSNGTKSNTVLAQEQPLGSGEFGQLGVQIRGRYDSRGLQNVLRPGILVEGEGAYFFEAWDAQDPFGYIEAHVGSWVRLAEPLLLSFHLRGRKIWGEFPYFEAAYIGGHLYPMGTKWNRWAGDASLGGLASLRWTLGSIKGVVPGDIGLFGMGDAARVFVGGEDSSKWHPSYGGGVFLTSFDRSGAFHLGAGSSPDDGFFFIFIANFAGLAFQ
ncbi:MAG: hypothetical protein JSW46_00805 [Gemmatimonadota bacterium]|nr:MAG: hypothetical protein JSW46_00805 [Gemmatimonadota bacterium]